MRRPYDGPPHDHQNHQSRSFYDRGDRRSAKDRLKPNYPVPPPNDTTVYAYRVEHQPPQHAQPPATQPGYEVRNGKVKTHHIHLESQKAVTAYFSSIHLLHR